MAAITCVCVCVCVVVSLYLQNHWMKIAISITETCRYKTLLNKIIVVLAVHLLCLKHSYMAQLGSADRS
jgi:hypothetical protein